MLLGAFGGVMGVGIRFEVMLTFRPAFQQCWLQWNAATECNIMLPLAATPMHYYPAAAPRCNPIFPFNSRRSRLPNPAVRGGMIDSGRSNRQ